MWSPPNTSTCPPATPILPVILAVLILVGTVISYLPQHLRIIRSGTSEGFSPWFLLLGSTAGTSTLFNVLILQWPLFRCCRVVSPGRCFSYLTAFFQVVMLWFLFILILILYIIYFPHHLKYQRVVHLSSPRSAYGTLTEEEDEASSIPDHPLNDDGTHGAISGSKGKLETTSEWRTGVIVSVVVFIHFLLFLFLSLTLLIALPPTPPHPLVRHLAAFLGLSSALLTAFEFTPQLYKTYRAKLVGALSISTMMIQVPGSMVLVLSLILSPGTEWSTWLVYVVGLCMQACLLIMCLIWKRRQSRLGINDFGVILDSPPEVEGEETALIR
ncbi:hypothetical protein M231_07481 [Tremella mesenterica]|uniref:PQ loop repeat protein n=1 Tax=Tremella mesenterica TaxID=5217 RepID=A0A4Q1BBV9_TREME|nr:uncharacterized protein TREMEDRAFT_40207 [Tremella mesenterica DSM 1558]EIW68107.1 hypothetical protein TREMEDRAFT_40207 [Tremella mesenterica DSM 1558]RXK35256.1 hypothetical protein M231_07481 [Tremella mesenterica]